MNRQRMGAAATLVGLMAMAIATSVFARIPEPDNIFYGVAGEGTVSVTLEVGGEQIATYRKGENADADERGYYVLRVPMDSLDPQTPGTARPGNTGSIHVNGNPSTVAMVSIGQRGSIYLLHLVAGFADSDHDGHSDAEDNCPDDANINQTDFDGDALGDVCDPDDDNDGMGDRYELDNKLDPYNAADATGDEDDDGFDNLTEHDEGTNPWSMRSNPRADRIQLYLRTLEATFSP